MSPVRRPRSTWTENPRLKRCTRLLFSEVALDRHTDVPSWHQRYTVYTISCDPWKFLSRIIPAAFVRPARLPAGLPACPLAAARLAKCTPTAVPHRRVSYQAIPSPARLRRFNPSPASWRHHVVLPAETAAGYVMTRDTTPPSARHRNIWLGNPQVLENSGTAQNARGSRNSATAVTVWQRQRHRRAYAAGPDLLVANPSAREPRPFPTPRASQICLLRKERCGGSACLSNESQGRPRQAPVLGQPPRKDRGDPATVPNRLAEISTCMGRRERFFSSAWLTLFKKIYFF